jgi:TolA-binding protein
MCARPSWAGLSRVTLVLSLLLVSLTPLGVRAQTPEEFARRRLESGRAFMKAQNYAEALKDFDALLQSYPTSALADDALLEVATYHLDVARDAAAADLKVKEILKTYPASDSAAMALVLAGQIALASTRDADAVTTALASFDRVPRLFPGSEAVPAAMYMAGEAARIGGRRDEAIRRLGQVSTQFPRSPWAARALLGSALSLVRTGQPGRAMEQLQRVRSQFPGTAAAANALDWNTVLYRLYIRAPAQPAFSFSGRTVAGPAGKLKDVVDVAIDGSGNVVVASERSVDLYGLKPAALKSFAAVEPRAIAFDRLGGLLTVHETGVRTTAGTPVTLTPPIVEGKPQEMKLTDLAVTASGEYLAADRETKAVMRFSATGAYAGDYAKQIEARRLAISDLDEVAVLDGSTKSIVLLARDGKVAKQIPARGSNYQLRNPEDVAFDRFGHLYVLDRSAVLVFSPDGSRLLTTFAAAEKSADAIGEGKAFALDGAGRMYVFDGRADTVKVYR